MSSALILILIDSGPNKRDIFFVNGSFSHGNKQHIHRIAERMHGRHRKMQGTQENLSYRGFFREIGVVFWVEMKEDGLKTGVKPGLLEY